MVASHLIAPRRQNASFMQMFAGHTGAVTAGRFSPDGKSLLTVSEDSSLRVWNPKTGTTVHTVSEPAFHSDAVVSLAAYGKRQLCATGGLDGAVCIVQYGNGRILQKLTGHTDSVECLEWADSSAERPVAAYATTWLASGSVDGNARVWNCETGQEVRTLHGHKGAVVKLMFTTAVDDRSSLLLLSASADRTVCVWDARQPTAVRTLHGHRAPILAAALTASGQALVTGGDDMKALAFALFNKSESEEKQ